MKNLYKQFDKLKMDTDLQPIDVNELEKARIKQHVLRNKKKNYMPKIASVAVAVVAASCITFGVAFPTLAAKLPIVGNLFESFVDDKSYVFDEFADYASDVGVTKESNGIQVTVTDAVYDGENITIAYTMTSDQDLGERPILEGKLSAEEFGDSYEHFGYFPNYLTKKISDTEYAGLFVYQLIEGPKPDEIHLSWDGDSIINLVNTNNATHGDWSFQMTLQALEGKTTELDELSMSTAVEGIDINVFKMTATPISTSIYLSEIVDIPTVTLEEDEWRGITFDYAVFDNLGNEYKTIHYKDIGHSPDFKNATSNARLTTTLFHADATSISIVPTVNIYKQGEQVGKDFILELATEPQKLEAIQIPLNK